MVLLLCTFYFCQWIKVQLKNRWSWSSSGTSAAVQTDWVQSHSENVQHLPQTPPSVSQICNSFVFFCGVFCIKDWIMWLNSVKVHFWSRMRNLRMSTICFPMSSPHTALGKVERLNEIWKHAWVSCILDRIVVGCYIFNCLLPFCSGTCSFCSS